MKKLVLVFSSILFFIIGCQDIQTEEELEKYRAQTILEEQNINLIQRLFVEINNKNLQVYDELCDPEYSFFSPSANPNALSLEEVKGFAETILKAFPDVNYSIKKIFADGDYVIVWNVFTGTHKGEFQGIPATGNKIEVSSFLLFHIQDGKITEEREEADMLGAMIQMDMALNMTE